MLTGASPFPADSQQETMIKRLTDDPMPLASARPDVRFPAELQRVIDRALARTPGDRYRSAGDLAREVKSLASHFTGAVDVEAGTQVVRPEVLKGAVPATRVDPAAAARAGKSGPRTPAAGAQPAAPTKGVPIVAVAIAALVVAAGGGAIAFKDRLFGGAASDSSATSDSSRIAIQPATTPDSGRQTSGGVTPPVTPLSNPDTSAAKPPTGGGARPPAGQTTSPGGTTTTPPRPADPPAPDYGALERQVLGFFEDIGFEDDPARRAEARRVGQQVYGSTAMSRPVRAKAAWLVMQGYLKEGEAARAREWSGPRHRARSVAAILEDPPSADVRPRG